MHRLELAADCGRCAGLCCIHLAFEASPLFARSKRAGMPCPNLRADCRCAIHDHLEARGFAGCAAYDCHGAGQRATGVLGPTPDARIAHDVFAILRELHELLWVLDGAYRLCSDDERELRADLAHLLGDIETVARGTARELLAADVGACRRRTRRVLARLRALR